MKRSLAVMLIAMAGCREPRPVPAPPGGNGEPPGSSDPFPSPGPAPSTDRNTFPVSSPEEGIEVHPALLRRPRHLSIAGEDLFLLADSGTDGRGGPIRITKREGTITRLAPDTEMFDPDGLAAAGDSVYWTASLGADGVLLKTPRTGGTTVTLEHRSDYFQAVVADETNVYWSSNVGSYSASLLQMPVEGGAVVTLAVNQANPFGLALDAAHLYWANWAVRNDQGEEGNQLMRAPIGGGAVQTLAQAGGDAFGPVVHDGRLYWMEWGPEDLVRSVDAEGGEPSTVTTGDTFTPGQMHVSAIHDGFFYWVSIAHDALQVSTIWRVPLTGGEPAVVAALPDALTSIAVDETGVYVTWARNSDGLGRIIRIKPR